MNIPVALLADAAIAHPDGKLYVIGGGLNLIYASTFPLVVPALALVIKVEFTASESGVQHSIVVSSADADGGRLLPEWTMQVTPQKNQQAPQLPVPVQVVLNMQGLTIPKEGDYVFSVVVDRREVASIPLHVVKQPAGSLPASTQPQN